MLKFVFTILIDPLGLPINALWEYLILLVLNEIAYRIAWEASPGGFGGSTIHWAVRTISFVVMWAVTYGIITAVKWIFAHWVLVLSVLGAVLFISGVAVVVVLRRKKQTAGEKNA